MKFVLAAAALLASASSAYAANFQNGSFETGSFVDNTGAATDDLQVGDTSMTGWTIIGGSDVAWESSSNPYSFVPFDGSYGLDLTGYTDRAPYGGVRQTFDTVAGHTYSLTYEVGNTAGNTGSSVAASVNGVALLDFTNTMPSSSSTVWQMASTSFVATGATTQLDLLGTLTSRDAIALDDVRVVDLDAGNGTGAVPEPASWAMMIGGMGAVGGTMRRTRRARTRAAAV